MRSFVYVITDRVGIHARPAGMLVKEAQQYRSEILVSKGEKEADAKNLMQIMSLGAKCGDEISVTVSIRGGRRGGLRGYGISAQRKTVTGSRGLKQTLGGYYGKYMA